MTEPVRVRFAPSPTGLLHIGNVRTALFNWLFARNKKGTFVLRVDDTDAIRSTAEYEKRLMEDLKWLGLDWDEGPGVESTTSYHQSERTDIYSSYAEDLIDKGKAYPCFCTKAELEGMRHDLLAKGRPPRYDRRCFRLSDEQRKDYLDQGKEFSVRFNIGNSIDNIEFKDLVKGWISFGRKALDDFILVRSDKMVSYNFATVIDDALMNITHIIRGEDHLSNTPKQILLYEACGFSVPKFAHLPMIFGFNKKPLSKRDEGISIDKVREQGFFKKSVINYISLLGWSSIDHREILSIEELISNFSLDRVSRSPSTFDFKKFIWVNKQYIKKCSNEDFLERMTPYLEKSGVVTSSVNKEKMLRIARVLKETVEKISQVDDYINIFFGEDVILSEDGVKVLEQEKALNVINKLKKELEIFDEDIGLNYKKFIKAVKEDTQVSGKALFMPIRVAVTGDTHGPELVDIFGILDKNLIIKRIDRVLETVNSKQDIGYGKEKS